jgi:hypothetical protein
MKAILALILVAVAAPALCAQSLSPLTAEGGKGKMHGQFTVSNPEVVDMTTTVSPVSFDWTPGGAVARPLDSSAVVNISESSAKIGPKQSHTFYFDATCNAPRCSLVFLTSSSFGHTRSGMAIKVVLPFSVYLCPADGAKGCREKIKQAAGLQ